MVRSDPAVPWRLDPHRRNHSCGCPFAHATANGATPTRSTRAPPRLMPVGASAVELRAADEAMLRAADGEPGFPWQVFCDHRSVRQRRALLEPCLARLAERLECVATRSSSASTSSDIAPTLGSVASAEASRCRLGCLGRAGPYHVEVVPESCLDGTRCSARRVVGRWRGCRLVSGR